MFLRYVSARYDEYKREEAYRFYISDILYYKDRNQTLSARFSEILHPEPIIDEGKGDEIVADLIKRHGLVIGGEYGD